MYEATKKYLSQIQRMNRKIENKAAEAEQLRSMISNVSSVKFDKVNVQTTPEQDKIGTAVSKIVDLENETSALVDELLAKRATIIEQIDSLDDVVFYHILSRRYVGGLDMNKIAREMGYTERHIRNVANKALKAFETKYGHLYIRR